MGKKVCEECGENMVSMRSIVVDGEVRYVCAKCWLLWTKEAKK